MSEFSCNLASQRSFHCHKLRPFSDPNPLTIDHTLAKWLRSTAFATGMYFAFSFVLPVISPGQHIESYGVFAGLNFPFTIDQGLQQDPRYYGRLTLRATPVGFCY